MKSLPGPPKASEASSPVTMKSLAEAAEDQVDAVAAVDDVVAVVALDVVVAADVGDDVVAGAAADHVVAVAAFEAVVAAVAPERVVADAGDEDVVAVGAAQHDMLVAGVLQVVRVGPGRVGVVADDQRRERAAADRDRRCLARVELLGLIDLEDEAGVRNTRPGRCVASVLAMISLANELFSSSVRKLSPAVRSR